VDKKANTATAAAAASGTPSQALGKRTHREIIDDFEGIYRQYKRQRRQQNSNQAQGESSNFRL